MSVVQLHYIAQLRGLEVAGGPEAGTAGGCLHPKKKTQQWASTFSANTSEPEQISECRTGGWRSFGQ